MMVVFKNVLNVAEQTILTELLQYKELIKNFLNFL